MAHASAVDGQGLLEEIRIGRADDPFDVEELGDPALDHGREQHARPVRPRARDERLLDDVEDVADDQADAPAVAGSRRRPAPSPRPRPDGAGSRSEAAPPSRSGNGAMRAAARGRRGSAAGSRRDTARRPAARPVPAPSGGTPPVGPPATAGWPSGRRRAWRTGARSARSPAGSGALAAFSVSARSRTPETTLALWARPSTSRIKATLPSPMMVAPAKTLMPLSCFCSGLTTISSVSWMASTTRPNWRSSACRTTMLISPLSAARRRDLELAVEVDQREQVARAAGRPGPRGSARSPRWACSPSRRTSSSRLTCGIA